MPEPADELDAARDDLRQGRLAAGAIRLAVVLRLAPALAPAVLDALAGRTDRRSSWSGATPCASSATSATRARRTHRPRPSSSRSERRLGRPGLSGRRARLRYCSAAALLRPRGPRTNWQTPQQGDPSVTERTLVLIKPDGVQRLLVGRILARYEERGLKLVGLKLVQVDRELAERHYAVHREQAVLRPAWSTSSPRGRSWPWPSKVPTRSR